MPGREAQSRHLIDICYLDVERREVGFHSLHSSQVGFPPRSPAELRAGAGLDSDLPLSTHTSTCSSQVGAPPFRSSPAYCLSSH